MVPSYDHSRYVERTLRSIFAQTLNPKKLIVIDDGSEDESPKIIERVLADCPFEAEFIARENRGLCATLNQGIANIDSEYFAYIGSDDVWLPGFLEERIKLLESRPGAALAFGNAFLIDGDEQIIDRTDNWGGFIDGNMLPLLLRGVIFSSPTVVYRTRAVKKYGWNEDALLEDYELYLKLSADGEFAFDKRVLSGWRQHGENASGHLPEMLREQLAAQCRNAEMLGIANDELGRIQAEFKLEAAANLARHGFRGEAFKLILENARSVRSASHLAELLFRVTVPQSLFQWNRRRKMRKTVAAYGKLEI
jgi:alpha-1,3-rhamnosyltransferase